MSNLEEAYQYCFDLTQKRESNFSLGFALLPIEKKRAIHVVYAFCRFVDDISDESEEKDARRLLEEWRQELSNIYDKKESSHPIGIALIDTLKSFKIPKVGFEELIEGCVVDQSKKIYQSIKELEKYCDYVATSIAKVSLPVYGYKRHPGVIKHGRDLSLAFQLTNILRDIGEDFERGRVYAPVNELKAYSLTPESVTKKEDPDNIIQFYRNQAERCEAYFQSGIKVLQYLDSDSRPCVGAMWRTYYRLLELILEDPIKAIHSQVSLSDEDKKNILEVAGNAKY